MKYQKEESIRRPKNDLKTVRFSDKYCQIAWT